MLLFISWVVLAALVGAVAHSRGRSEVGWFFLSMALSPLLGLIGVLLVSNLRGAAQAPNESTHHACPACAEQVLNQALVCKHCGAAQDAPAFLAHGALVAQSQVNPLLQRVVAWVIVLGVGASILMAFK